MSNALFIIHFIFYFVAGTVCKNGGGGGGGTSYNGVYREALAREG